MRIRSAVLCLFCLTCSTALSVWAQAPAPEEGKEGVDYASKTVVVQPGELYRVEAWNRSGLPAGSDSLLKLQVIVDGKSIYRSESVASSKGSTLMLEQEGSHTIVARCSMDGPKINDCTLTVTRVDRTDKAQ
jgi:hypothetical protein